MVKYGFRVRSTARHSASAWRKPGCPLPSLTSQDVYRLQQALINDKHIEVIVRQMLRKGRNSLIRGDSDLLEGEQADVARVKIANADRAGKEPPATFRRVLMGITKASLNTESLSLLRQFRNRVLTEAAVSGKKVDLRGLKET